MIAWRSTVILLFALVLTTVRAESRDTGVFSQNRVAVGGNEIQVFGYRPLTCDRVTLAFIFAGYNRNGQDYLDRTVRLARRHCLAAFAPVLDRKRYPSWRYQRGGVARRGEIRPERQWTASVVKALIAWARRTSNCPDGSYILFGHSAGGQFLSRVAAYSQLKGAHRIVIANPSSHVVPDEAEDAPYGFGRIFDAATRTLRLRDYLAQPVTIYMGGADKAQGRLVLKNEQAMRQGRNRFERGERVFAMARDRARGQNWSFNWKFVVVPKVGHSSRRMLRAPQAAQAFGLGAADNAKPAVTCKASGFSGRG